MYGFLNQALQNMIKSNFGKDVWEEIKFLSKLEVEGEFGVRTMYDDKLTYDIVDTASNVLGLTKDEIWEKVGGVFFAFCEESGYGKILQSLGGTLKRFLECLDALHDHLSTIYPGMRPPSFRCSDTEDGRLLLHYYSDRKGLEYLVVGLVKAVAKKMYQEVEVAIVQDASEYGPDHVQLLITNIKREQSIPKNPLESNKGELGFVVNKDQTNERDFEMKVLSEEPRISPATFCKAFPFHVMFNRGFQIQQTGHSIMRLVKELEDPIYSFLDIFEIVRPQIPVSFDNIVAHANSVFVLTVRNQIRPSKRKSISNPYSVGLFSGFGFPQGCQPKSREESDGDSCKQRTRFKGQMLYVSETDKLLFLCSPHVGGLEELFQHNLSLSDIPMHDSTRDLLLLSEQFRAEYELTQRLEVMNDKLQQTYRELEMEKQLADRLLNSILPQTVANQLRAGQPVEPVKYRSVSILFSGICDFEEFCTHNAPMKVVDLLNDLYTRFDALAEPGLYDVYKVETVGDKYMMASGLPEKTNTHAKNIALVSLDMLDIARGTAVDGRSVKITIGIHSGEVVAGVVGEMLPHYALFGNTVCIASRMESTGVSDHINLSQDTYQCLQSKECQDSQLTIKQRGDVPMKGRKQPMKCYFLFRNALS